MEYNVLYNQDCFEGMKSIPDKSINLIITDPPYLIPHISTGGTVNNLKKMNSSLQDLKKQQDITVGYDIKQFAQEVKRLQGNDINAYFWCNKAQIPEYISTYVIDMKCKFEIICWHKRNALPTYANKYLSDTEYCLFFHKGKGQTHPQSFDDAKTYFLGMINHQDKKKYKHPSIKPIEYIKTMIRNSSNVGDIVLDPFIGSGTTAVACIEEGRKFIGYELNEDYYRIACNRISEHTINISLFD